MSIFLYPSEYYDSTYSINFKKYYNLGYRGIIFDIDNTLVPHNAMHDERSRRLFKNSTRRLVDITFTKLESQRKKAS